MLFVPANSCASHPAGDLLCQLGRCGKTTATTIYRIDTIKM